MGVGAEIDGKELVIRVDLEPTPRPSKSGKTLVVASSRGNQPTTAELNGHRIVIGVNAYIPR